MANWWDEGSETLATADEIAPPQQETNWWDEGSETLATADELVGPKPKDPLARKPLKDPLARVQDVWQGFVKQGEAAAEERRRQIVAPPKPEQFTPEQISELRAVPERGGMAGGKYHTREEANRKLAGITADPFKGAENIPEGGSFVDAEGRVRQKVGQADQQRGDWWRSMPAAPEEVNKYIQDSLDKGTTYEEAQKEFGRAFSANGQIDKAAYERMRGLHDLAKRFVAGGENSAAENEVMALKPEDREAFRGILGAQAQASAKGVAGAASEGLVRGVKQFYEGQVQNQTGVPNLPAELVSPERRAQGEADAAQRQFFNQMQSMRRGKDPLGIVGGVGQTLPYMAAVALAAKTGGKALPGVGSAVGGMAAGKAMSTPQMYNDLINEGVSKESAQKWAEIGGWASGALESIAPDFPGFNAGMFNKGLAGWLKNQAKEVGQEGAQGVAEAFGAAMANVEDGKKGALAARLGDVLASMPETAGVVGLLGLGGAGVGAASRRLQQQTGRNQTGQAGADATAETGTSPTGPQPQPQQPSGQVASAPPVVDEQTLNDALARIPDTVPAPEGGYDATKSQEPAAQRRTPDLSTAAGAATWAAENPEAAKSYLANPSRTNLSKATGIPRKDLPPQKKVQEWLAANPAGFEGGNLPRWMGMAEGEAKTDMAKKPVSVDEEAQTDNRQRTVRITGDQTAGDRARRLVAALGEDPVNVAPSPPSTPSTRDQAGSDTPAPRGAPPREFTGRTAKADNEIWEKTGADPESLPSSLKYALRLDPEALATLPVPKDAKFLGAGMRAAAWELPDGTVLRIGNVKEGADSRRPAHPDILQAISSERWGDGFVVERLPKAFVPEGDANPEHNENLSPSGMAFLEDLIDRHDQADLNHDLHPGNIGKVGKEWKVIDPSAIDLRLPAKPPLKNPLERKPPPPPLKNPLSKAPSGFKDEFGEAFAALDTKGRNMVPIHKLREALPQYTQAEFNAEVRKLREAGLLSADSSEGDTVGFTAEQRATHIREGGSTFAYLGYKNRADIPQPAQTTKPALRDPLASAYGRPQDALAERPTQSSAKPAETTPAKPQEAQPASKGFAKGDAVLMPEFPGRDGVARVLEINPDGTLQVLVGTRRIVDKVAPKRLKPDPDKQIDQIVPLPQPQAPGVQAKSKGQSEAQPAQQPEQAPAGTSPVESRQSKRQEAPQQSTTASDAEKDSRTPPGPRPDTAARAGGPEAKVEAKVEEGAVAADPDEDLAVRASQGDRDAVGELYAKHAPMVEKYLQKHYPRVADEALSKLGETLSKGFPFQPGGDVKAWLKRVAQREALSELARLKKAEPVAEGLEQAPSGRESDAPSADMRLSELEQKAADKVKELEAAAARGDQDAKNRLKTINRLKGAAKKVSKPKDPLAKMDLKGMVREAMAVRDDLHFATTESQIIDAAKELGQVKIDEAQRKLELWKTVNKRTKLTQEHISELENGGFDYAAGKDPEKLASYFRNKYTGRSKKKGERLARETQALRYFDETAREMADTYPELFGDENPNDVLWRVIKEGKPEAPSLDIEAAIERVDKNVRQGGARGGEQAAFAGLPIPIPRSWWRGMEKVLNEAWHGLKGRGGAPKAVQEAMFERDNKIQAWLGEMQFAKRDLDEALEATYGKQVPGIITQEIDAALHDDKLIRHLDPELQPAVTRLRHLVDDLSTRLVMTGALDPKTQTAVLNNLGTYLHQTYRKWTDPDWAEKVKADPQEWADILQGIQHDFPAKTMVGGKWQLLSAQQVQSGQYPVGQIRPTTDEDASDLAESLLATGGDKQGAKGSSAATNVLKHRHQFSEWFKKLYGLEVDPRQNVTATVGKLAKLTAEIEMWQDIRQAGEIEGWMADSKFNKQKLSTKLAGEDSLVRHGVAGQYVSREVRDEIERLLAPENAKGAWRMLQRILSVSTAAKTIGGLATHITNAAASGLNFYAKHPIRMGRVTDKNAFKAVAKDNGWWAHDSFDKAGYEKFILELRRNGILGDSAVSQHLEAGMRAAINGDLDLAADGVMGKVKSGLGAISTAYSFGDQYWKAWDYMLTKQLSQEAHPNWSDEEHQMWAAKRVNTENQSYKRQGRLVKGLAQFPIIGEIGVMYAADQPRMIYNRVKHIIEDIKSGNKVLQKNAAARIAGHVVMASLPIGLAMASRYLAGGLSDDEEEAIREFAAPWDKNIDTLYLGKDKDGKPRTFNLTRWTPYATVGKAVNAAMRGRDWEQGIYDAAAETVGSFVGWTIPAEKIIDVARNQTEAGREVYNPADTDANKRTAIAKHWGGAFVPGTGEALTKLYQEPSWDNLLRVGGLRPTTTDPKKSLDFRARDYADGKLNADRLLSVPARAKDATDASVEEAFRNSERARRANFDSMVRAVQAAKALGVKQPELVASLKGRGISEDDIGLLLAGVYTVRSGDLSYLPPERQVQIDKLLAAEAKQLGEAHVAHLQAAQQKELVTKLNALGEDPAGKSYDAKKAAEAKDYLSRRMHVGQALSMYKAELEKKAKESGKGKTKQEQETINKKMDRVRRSLSG